MPAQNLASVRHFAATTADHHVICVTHLPRGTSRRDLANSRSHSWDQQSTDRIARAVVIEDGDQGRTKRQVHIHRVCNITRHPHGGGADKKWDSRVLSRQHYRLTHRQFTEMVLMNQRAKIVRERRAGIGVSRILNVASTACRSVPTLKSRCFEQTHMS